MRRILLFTTLILLAVAFSQAQTIVTVDPTTTLYPAATVQRPGILPCAPTDYDEGQCYSNLLFPGNVGFEGGIFQESWQVVTGASPLSTTQFNTNQNNSQFDQVAAGYWIGATMTVQQSANGGAELGCVSTITANTVTSGTTPLGPTYTFSPACAAAIQPGDVIVLSKSYAPFSAAQLATNGFGVNVATTGSGVFSSVTDVCGTAACGTYSGRMDTSGGSSSVTISWQRDNLDQGGTFVNKFRLISGYQFQYMAHCVSGACGVTPGFAGRGISCFPGTQTTTGTWTLYTQACSATEGATGTTGGLTIQFTKTDTGIVDIDNVYFGPATVTNPTIFLDPFVAALKTMTNTGATGNPGTCRYGPSPDSETLDSWILPATARLMAGQTSAGLTSAFYTSGQSETSLQDHLALCHALGLDPYLIMPITLSTTDAANLSDFMYGSSGTTYGAKRIALGGPTGGYQTQFNVIHYELGNENWNTGFQGHIIGPRTGTATEYTDYAARFNTIATAMRGAASYVPSQSDLVFNLQTANAGGSTASAFSVAHPDSGEMESYTCGYLFDTATNAQTFTPCFAEDYVNEVQANINPLNGQFARGVFGTIQTVPALNTCGPSHTAACKLNIYEENNGTAQGPGSQAALDGLVQGGAFGVKTFNQFLMQMQLGGIFTQNFYQGAQYIQFQNSWYIHDFGIAVDFGGASSSTNSATFGGNFTPRGTGLGFQLINQLVVGKMISCPISGSTGAATFTLGSSATSTSISSTTSTVTIIAANSYQVGQWIRLSGTFISTVGAAAKAAGTTDGTTGVYEITAATGSQYSFAFTNAGFSSTSETGVSTSTNNGIASQTGVPSIYAYCFQTAAGSYAIGLVNESLTTSRTISFAGTGAPTTGVTVQQLAPTNPTDTNEAGSNNVTSTTAAAVSLTTLTGQNLTSGITVPADSAIVLTFSTSSTGPAITIKGPASFSGKVVIQ